MTDKHKREEPQGLFTTETTCGSTRLYDAQGDWLASGPGVETVCAMLNAKQEPVSTAKPVEGLQKLGWLYGWAKAVFDGFHSNPHPDKIVEQKRKQRIKDFAECRKTLTALGVKLD